MPLPKNAVSAEFLPTFVAILRLKDTDLLDQDQVMAELPNQRLKTIAQTLFSGGDGGADAALAADVAAIRAYAGQR